MNKITTRLARLKPRLSLKNLKNQKLDFENLRKFNLIMAVLHALQGIAILALAKSSLLPVNTNFLSMDELASRAVDRPVLAQATRHLFDVNLVHLVAVFLFVSAIAHAVIATWYRKGYEGGLARNINRARWINYAVSASIMIIVIALLSGVYDISSLIMLAGFVVVTNMIGLYMELHNDPGTKASWMSFGIGAVTGFIPWVVIGIYLWHASLYGGGNVPAFVQAIFVSMLVLFGLVAAIIFMQNSKKGKFADYLYAERAFMILGLVTKSLLSWLVFAGALRS